MANDGRDDGERARLAEVLVLCVLAALTYHEMRDPARLLGWLFGGLPARPVDQLRPWLSLLRGLTNVALLGVVVCVVSRARWTEWVRRAAAAWFVIALLVVPMAAHMEVRFRVDEAPGNAAPYRSALHDGGVAQTEMALSELFAGENPYSAHYDRPPMTRSADSDPAGWRYLGYPYNPAYDHFPYLPGVLIVSAPPAALSRALFGGWDQRVVYLGAALLLAFALGRLVAPGPARRMLWLATLLNPLVAGYVVVGRNDILVAASLALFAAALARDRWRAAAVWLGIALALKQFAVFVLPFYLLITWEQAGRSWREAARRAWPALAIPVLCAVPFLSWDAAAFLEDALLFNFGVGDYPYPVRWDGHGVTPLAYALGLVDSPAGANPFAWLFPIATLVTLAWGAWWIRRDPSPWRALVASGVLVFVALFSSRFFAENYLVVPVALWVVAYLTRREGRAELAARA